jgi:D-alanyl-D-alanine carboxypeptidase
MLFLIVILAAIVIIFSVKAIVDTVRNSGGTTTAPSTMVNGETTAPLKDPVYTTPVAGAWNEGYVTANRKDTLVNEGNLILVNNDYAYTFPASLKLKEMLNKKYGYGSVYVLGTGMTYPTGPKPVELSEVIVDSIKTMLADMKAANPTLTETRRLMILSGYRTLDKQQALYENDPDSGLTAKPGHSEHHTGLTFDIRIKVNDQSEIEYLNDAEQAWITANCAKYGFILRYTEDNKSITQIGGEDWHFRYVGVAHATYMVENDLCLEEYLAFLREKHTYGVNDPLKYAAEGKDYTIYYFPASVEKDNTDIYVPSSGHYEISGDNMNGFIVTVTNS